MANGNVEGVIGFGRRNFLVPMPRFESFEALNAWLGECPIDCVSVIWFMLPERSKDDDHFQGTAGRTSEGLRAA
jgi:hypothetical protein